MKTNASTVSKGIRSGKSLERELAAATKLFYGKETESNWEDREQTLHALVSILHHDKLQSWKDIFLQGIRPLVFGIADATQSLRTKYALVAFDLITTIGQMLGTQLDATTFETLFTGLLQCVHSSKQLIVNKSKDAMISFISTTSYHSKAITLLCLALDDRNPQSRHLAALYMDVFLQKHAPNTLVRENMGGSLNSLKKMELFLKTGLMDATPAVRQVCYGTFWIYRKYWPSNGDRLLDSFDTTTKRRLEKAKLSSTLSRAQSSILGKRSGMTTNDRHQLLATRKRPSSSKDAHPTSLIPAHTPALASASLLHMLRSNDTTLNCEGLDILAKRLFTHLRLSPSSSSSLSYEMVVLPSSVPRRADLIPILLDYLSPQRMQNDAKMCNHLMSWDCISGIFVHIFSLHQFLPSIVLAGQRHYRDYGKPRQQSKERHSICTLGLLRLKLYLKYHDKILMKYLLDILLMTTTFGGAGLRDPNAKCELETTQGTHEDLVYGLVSWMDELVCGYIGLNDDDSENDLVKGCTQPWVQSVYSSLGVATQWFADKDHLQSCLESVLRLLKSYSSTTSSAVFTSLITLVGRLRLVNARVFSVVLAQSEEDVRLLLDTCLGRWRSGVDDGCREGTPVLNTPSICQMESDNDTDDDPPPPYEDIALSSPPFWPQLHMSPSVSSASSQDVGLEEDTLLNDEVTYDVWDTSLDGILSEDSSLISTYDTIETYGDLSTATPTDRIDPSLEVTNSTTANNDTNSTYTEPLIETTDNGVPTKEEDGKSDQEVLMDAIYQLAITTSDNRLCALERLKRLCEQYSTKGEGVDGRNGRLWRSTYKLGALDGSLLELLIGQLTTYLQQGPQHQLHTTAMLRLLEQLVVHHSDLIYYENDTLILKMVKALIDTKVEKYGRIPSLVDQVQDLLLSSLSINSWMTLTVQLLKHYFEPGNHTSQALPTVFSMIAKSAPKLTSVNDIVQKCAGSFEQGINHPTLSIRLSCVNALVELATRGQCDIKGYLPNLRKEQEDLLDHYIRQRSNEKQL